MTREELHTALQIASYNSLGGSYGKEILNQYLDKLDEEILEVVDDCFHAYASNFRDDAREYAIELLKEIKCI